MYGTKLKKRNTEKLLILISANNKDNFDTKTIERYVELFISMNGYKRKNILIIGERIGGVIALNIATKLNINIITLGMHLMIDNNKVKELVSGIDYEKYSGY